MLKDHPRNPANKIAKARMFVSMVSGIGTDRYLCLKPIPTGEGYSEKAAIKTSPSDRNKCTSFFAPFRRNVPGDEMMYSFAKDIASRSLATSVKEGSARISGKTPR